jgi:hypothetical protein
MLTELGAFVLPALPLLALLVFLVLGRFPGEKAIARLSRRLARAAGRRRRRDRVSRPVERLASAIPRGGRLVASGMARRPPPAIA